MVSCTEIKDTGVTLHMAGTTTITEIKTQTAEVVCQVHAGITEVKN